MIRTAFFSDNMIAHYYCIIALFLISPLNCCEEKNTTNAFDIRDERYMTIKYTVVLLFSLSLLYSMISTVLMAIVCCNRDNLYGHSFIVIVSQIIICQFINFTPQITIVLPKILLSKNSSYGSRTEWINRTFATINVFSFYDILCFSFLLTLNRFVAIILPKCNVLFESTKLYFVLFFAWLIVFALTFVDFYYCTRSFQVSRLRWIRDCSKQSSDRGHS
ncbi:unnamed protein product [Wuchereria bancrofti]|uniref:G-protein coupled receptors family 1 profile domain-containing protein n=1 Tax=Wuchereria bancrofti TaxID=6293 RepID=A0A3P7DQ20_WUCBA|nr:unnamed protein product [Wuchereria bancrofti]